MLSTTIKLPATILNPNDNFGPCVDNDLPKDRASRPALPHTNDDDSEDESSIGTTDDESLCGPDILPRKTVPPSVNRPLSDHDRKVAFARELAALEKRSAFERVPRPQLTPPQI